MPFGKFRGWMLNELPDGYLAWLISLPDLRDPLCAAVQLEWLRRTGGIRTSNRNDALYVAPGDRDLFSEIVEAGYKQTAKRKHPDHGGDTEDMRRLNQLIAALREQLD